MLHVPKRGEYICSSSSRFQSEISQKSSFCLWRKLVWNPHEKSCAVFGFVRKVWVKNLFKAQFIAQGWSIFWNLLWLFCSDHITSLSKNHVQVCVKPRISNVFCHQWDHQIPKCNLIIDGCCKDWYVWTLYFVTCRFRLFCSSFEHFLSRPSIRARISRFTRTWNYWK